MQDPQGDRHEKFIALMMRYQPDLRAFIASVIWDRHLCEDLLQEAALVLWRKFDTYDDSRSFGAWARGVATNLLKQSLAAHRHALSFPDAAVEAVRQAYEETPPFGPEKQEALRVCLQALPDHSRELLALRYEKSLSLGAMAETLQKSLHAVHMMLARLRAKLLECMRHRLVAQQR